MIAALGGVIAYRTLFLESSSAVIVTETDVRELPNTARVVGGNCPAGDRSNCRLPGRTNKKAVKSGD